MAKKEYRRSAYSEKLRDPRWQKMRLKVMERDEFRCVICGDDASTLNVHHRWYEGGREPWDYPVESLVTLCESCHEQEGNNRRWAEEKLLAVIKQKYFAHDLVQMEKIFLHMPVRHVEEVQLSAVAWYLASEERIDAIITGFFAQNCPPLPSSDSPAKDIRP